MDYTFRDVGFELTNFDQNELILLRKQMSSFLKQARKNAKPDKCFYCGKNNPQICNSHSVPEFLLKNIAIDGELLYTNLLVNIPTEKEKKD